MTIGRIPHTSIRNKHVLPKYTEKSYGINTLSMCKIAKKPPALMQEHCNIQICSGRALNKLVTLAECLLH